MKGLYAVIERQKRPITRLDHTTPTKWIQFNLPVISTNLTTLSLVNLIYQSSPDPSATHCSVKPSEKFFLVRERLVTATTSDDLD